MHFRKKKSIFQPNSHIAHQQKMAQFVEQEARTCRKTKKGQWVVCSEEEEGEEEEEEEIFSDSARDTLFFDDGKVEEDVSVYAQCDQLDDERTREAVQREVAEIKSRHQVAQSRKNKRKAVAWGGAAAVAVGKESVCKLARRKLVGGRRRTIPSQHKLAPIFTAKKKPTAVVVDSGKCATHGRRCHKRGCEKLVCAGGFYWCKVHDKRERNSAGRRKRLQKEVEKVVRQRKKILALVALAESRDALVASLVDSAPPSTGTCRLCAQPPMKGIMVCERHHRLGQLRASVGARTIDDLRRAVQRLDKHAEQIRTQLVSVKQTVVRHMTSGEISFHTRTHAKQYETRRLRCAHCGHKWTEEANVLRARECPMCGDEDFQ